MEPTKTSPVQPRQRQKLLSRPSDMADSPGQDPEVDQIVGINSAIGTSFKTIGPVATDLQGRAQLQQPGMLSTPPRVSAWRPQVQKYNLTIQNG